MSQTETLMLVALGFAAASLLALVIGRSLWKLAERVHGRSARREVPTVVAELRADRDRLRAESAMQARKFDMQVAAMKARLAEQIAEVSRHRNRLELLTEAFRKREVALTEREDESRGMREQLEPLEEELAKRTESVQILEQQARDKDETIARLGREIVELKLIIDEQDRDLAAFDEADAPQRAPAMLTTQDRLHRRIEDLTILSQEIANQREQFVQERDKFSALRQALALPPPYPGENRLDSEESRERVEVIDERGRAIEEKLATAERESQALAQELRSLDEAWSTTTQGLDRPGMEQPAAATVRKEVRPPTEPTLVVPPREPPPKQRVAGNVVSLAARIRALQRDATR